MNSTVNENNIPLQKIEEEFLKNKKVEIFILREDQLHSIISGNKWRKLKYNLLAAQEKGHSQLLTFGGAYSNHIAATAAAGNEFGFKTIGIIRGEQTLPLNATLQLAVDNGMELKYVSRKDYRKISDTIFIEELQNQFGDFYLIPEGGSNTLAVKGCSEIINSIHVGYDVICSACGTGGTIAGIISALKNDIEILGFPALKGGDFLKDDIEQLLVKYENEFNCKIENNNWRLITDYHFGGYAKIKPELVDFIRTFENNHKILLDFIYTGKMIFGIYEIIKHTNQLDDKRIIIVHSGGIQGNKGFEERYNITI